MGDKDGAVGAKEMGGDADFRRHHHHFPGSCARFTPGISLLAGGHSSCPVLVAMQTVTGVKRTNRPPSVGDLMARERRRRSAPRGLSGRLLLLNSEKRGILN